MDNYGKTLSGGSHYMWFRRDSTRGRYASLMESTLRGGKVNDPYFEKLVEDAKDLPVTVANLNVSHTSLSERLYA